MKKCPNCNKMYADYDQYSYICRYKLKYIEDSEVRDYCPEPTGSKFTNPEKPKPTVTCPYCKSTNTKKITNTSKAIHTALFGIFSIGRNTKNYHCNQCGSDF